MIFLRYLDKVLGLREQEIPASGEVKGSSHLLLIPGSGDVL